MFLYKTAVALYKNVVVYGIKFSYILQTVLREAFFFFFSDIYFTWNYPWHCVRLIPKQWRNYRGGWDQGRRYHLRGPGQDLFYQ